MARATGHNTMQQLRDLREIGATWSTTKSTLDQLAEERDRAILAAAERGASRRAIAEMAGVSVGRVQQIIDSNRRWPRDHI
jgi:DNA-directed RNA polymerase specialized sigma24 family protein